MYFNLLAEHSQGGRRSRRPSRRQEIRWVFSSVPSLSIQEVLFSAASCGDRWPH